MATGILMVEAQVCTNWGFAWLNTHSLNIWYTFNVLFILNIWRLIDKDWRWRE